MTLIVLASVKGSPGTTTLATLIGASWPGERQVVVADCDPSGGDLAMRFGLQDSVGWSTLAAATRRGADSKSLLPHLQSLPGGLDVLAGVRRIEPNLADAEARINVANALSQASLTADIVVDAGRLLPGLVGSAELLAAADDVVLVARRNPFAVVQIHERAESLRQCSQGRLHLLIVGNGSNGVKEIEKFSGIHLLGEMPFDVPAAAVASGESGSARRLERSSLAAGCRRVARCLSQYGASDCESVGSTVTELDWTESRNSEEKVAAGSESDYVGPTLFAESEVVAHHGIRVLP